MSSPVIHVEGLGKRYFLSHEKRQETLRDSLAHTARRLWRGVTRSAPAAPEGEEF